jgi:putative transposase
MRKIQLRADHYYHVYNRGTSKIFFQPENWAFFLGRLHHYFDQSLADIVAYCLMPNHYHLLVYLKTDHFGDKVMQPFTVSYTKAINKQQGRIGPIFQGPFQAKLVEKNEYLLHLSRYIHLNPVTAGLVVEPGEWAFSSYRDYAGMRDGKLPKPDIVLAQFEKRQAYVEFVCSGKPAQAEVPESVLFD